MGWTKKATFIAAVYIPLYFSVSTRLQKFVASWWALRWRSFCNVRIFQSLPVQHPSWTLHSVAQQCMLCPLAWKDLKWTTHIKSQIWSSGSCQSLFMILFCSFVKSPQTFYLCKCRENVYLPFKCFYSAYHVSDHLTFALQFTDLIYSASKCLTVNSTVNTYISNSC